MPTTFRGGVAAPGTSFFRSVAALVGVNLLLFIGYRAAFITSFAPGLSVGEMLAVAAIVMALLFVVADLAKVKESVAGRRR